MPSQLAPWNIYREALAPLKNGDALWEPSPIYSYRRVRPGDVGYTRRGTFHLLFSAGIPLGTRVLGTDVPFTFEPLDPGPIVTRSARSPGYLHTAAVKQIGVDVGSSAAVACPVEPGTRIAFELTSEQGAALITQHQTYREDVEWERRFVNYIKKHYESWVDFARERDHGEDIRPILVTGVDLTREFAMVAYSDNQTRIACGFSVGVPAVASASTSLWGSWGTQGLVHTNCGPGQTLTRESRNLTERSALESEIPDEYNQCVFIRYYTIRKWGFIPKVIKAGAGPHELPKEDPGDDTAREVAIEMSDSDDDLMDVDYDYSEARQGVIHNVPLDDRDGFDVVAEFILKKSNARSLLLHNRDIQGLLPESEEETTSLLDKPTVVESLLETSAVAERVEIDGNGVGQLASHRENRSSNLAREDTRIETYSATRINALLDAAIDALDLAKEVSRITPAKAVFGSVIALIKDTTRRRPSYPGLGLSCAEVCLALNRGVDGRQLDELSQPVLDAIKQLTTIVAEIRRKTVKWDKQNKISRFIYRLDDKTILHAWKRDLERALHTELAMDAFVDFEEMAFDEPAYSDHRRPSLIVSSEISKARRSKGFRSHRTRLGESPPPPLGACFGRDELIGKIVGLAENCTPIALIGAGGIGKTSVALAVLHHDRIVERFGDNRRFIRCDQFPISHAGFVARLSKVIGAGIKNPEDLTTLRQFLSSEEMFIVLDNAESIFDPQGTNARKIFAAVEELSQFRNICLCITSRVTAIPSGCERFDIPTLSRDAAHDAFYRIHGDCDRMDLVNNILEQLDFHPLSVTLLATAAYQNKWDNVRLAREWEQLQTGVLQTEYCKNFATTIELSLASPLFQELGPDARVVLGVVAFFPQGIDENNVDCLLPTISDRTNIFDKFCALSLTYRSKGFVRMLAPLRDYLSPKDPKLCPLICTIKERYFTRMSVDLDPTKPQFKEARWIASEDVNVEHLLNAFTSIGASSDDVWDACANFMSHLFWHKPRLTVLGPKIEGLPDAHRSKSKCLLELSRLFGSIGNHTERKRLLTCALDCIRGGWCSYLIARVLGSLSDANRQMGRYKEGITMAKDAAEVFERLEDIAEEAGCLIDFAWLLFDDNQLDDAEKTTLRAIILGKGDQFIASASHCILGYIYRSKGEDEKAVHHLKETLRFAYHLDWHSQLAVARCPLALLFPTEDKPDTHVIERVKTHVVDTAYYLGRAWSGRNKGRPRDMLFKALRAAEVFAMIGAADELQNCADFIRSIEEEHRVFSTKPPGELLETVIPPTPIDSSSSRMWDNTISQAY